MLGKLRTQPADDETAIAAAMGEALAADLDAATFAFGGELTAATNNIIGRTADCLERVLAHHRRERERLGKELASVKRRLSEHTLCEQVLAAATESLSDAGASEGDADE